MATNDYSHLCLARYYVFQSNIHSKNIWANQLGSVRLPYLFSIVLQIYREAWVVIKPVLVLKKDLEY